MMTEIGAVQSVVSASSDMSIRNADLSGNASAVGQLDFATMVAQMASQAADTVRIAETAAQGAVKGQVPLAEVVDKVLEAERTLNSTIAVRDKVIAAYLELTRMQI